MKQTMYCPDMKPFVPTRILAVGAHPDDIDFGASGSVALWAQKGAHVEYVVITDGSKGSSDRHLESQSLIRTRQQEQQAAAKKLGVRNVHFLSYEDGALAVTMELKCDLVRLIRRVRPDTVIVMDPTMVYSTQLGFVNHPDHRAAGQATLDVVFPLARDHLSFPDLLTEEQLEPHKVANLLLIHLDKQNCLVDISGTIDLKLAALRCHASQIPDNKTLESMVRGRAKTLGAEAGFAYAEGFVRLELA